jgi:hypothetical protein
MLRLIAVLCASFISLASPVFGQIDDSKLGKVHFETSCTPEAQKLFDRGMLYQHSFRALCLGSQRSASAQTRVILAGVAGGTGVSNSCIA